MVDTPKARRREARAASRAEKSGSGPVGSDWQPRVNPGAGSAFGLFAEVLLTGLLITVAGILIVTLPAALAAGMRHLRRFVSAEDSRMALFWSDLRQGVVPGLPYGLGAGVLGAVLLLDIDLARSGALPGGGVVQAIGWIGLVALCVALLIAASAWTPEVGWREAFRSVPSFVKGDLAGTGYVVATVGFLIVITWALTPLLIPGLGCAALAVVAIPGRPRKSED
ncbi:hypothetical protein [Tessaracoccus defluvii]|uniref:DUF624 domain-containing protein n=1 Tax=Tessaracoccus defluvii TaxID=1285901 RepID=A0A7H0H5E3_9ACTN|nr:hypothetical protein [Tessaracoccus defluvii]QNP55759.1 hypothetical protein H9L22_16750 [Tessaracoccus defluvii]